MSVKKIYSKQEVMVSDNLINSSDSVINSTLHDCEPGTIIYTAGYSSVKQKSIDNTWVSVSLGASGSVGKDGADGKSTYELAKELDPDIGDLQTWLASLKGDKGELGAPGATGPAGAKGDNGANGKDGSDGVSPTVATSAVAGGTQVTITDKDGEHQFTVLNGKDGTNGSNGAQGENGIGVKDLTLTVDTTGKITGGTLTLTDESQVPITINTSD